MLTNQTYIGRIKHKTQTFKGEHTPIIDQKLFDDVAAIMRSHARGGGNHLVNKYQALLKGLIYCPACNYSMVHNVARRGAKVYRYYTCVTAIKRGRKYCPSPSLPAADIEAAVVGQIRCIADDPGLRRDVLEQSSKRCEAELAELNTQRTQLTQRLNRQHDQMKHLTISTDAGSGDSERLAALHQEVARIIESLEVVDGEIKRLSAEQIDERDVNAAFSDFGTVWNELNIREKSAVLTLLISRIEFDADESSLSISMHPAGIKTFSAEATEQQHEANS
jgi:site-specific DNA recombinase